VDSSEGFHHHVEPSWAVKDGVWGVEGGSKSLVQAVNCIKGGMGIVSVRDGFRGKWCCNVDRGYKFIFDKCDHKVIWVWENGRNVNRGKGETVVHWMGRSGGRWRKGSQTSK
jgi:hypothetical protein